MQRVRTRTTRGAVKETDVAEVGKAWLERRGYEVFQEVVTPWGRRDLVGRTSRQIICVEAKLRLGLNVIAQADRASLVANETWVVVLGKGSRRREHQLALIACQTVGVGVLYAYPEIVNRTDDESFFRVALVPTFRNPKNVAQWDRLLHPEQKSAAPAGTNGGGYVTEFSLTAKRLAAHVAAHPGCTVREAVLAIEHHYERRSTAISRLSSLLQPGKERAPALAGIRIEGSGSKATLHPVSSETF